MKSIANILFFAPNGKMVGTLTRTLYNNGIVGTKYIKKREEEKEQDSQ